MALVVLRDADAVKAAFQKFGPFDAVCHVAAELAHEAQDKAGLWKSNVDGTWHVAEACQRHGVNKLIFTSTNCLWGKPLNRPVVENDEPFPVEVYGKSKLAAEEVLLALKHPASDIFHVGSHNATSLEGSYRYVIEHAGSTSKIYHLPEFPMLPVMRLCHILKWIS
jgi:UDP-glucose 4-epimerase